MRVDRVQERVIQRNLVDFRSISDRHVDKCLHTRRLLLSSRSQCYTSTETLSNRKIRALITNETKKDGRLVSPYVFLDCVRLFVMCQTFCLFLDEDSIRKIEKDLRARVPCRLHCAVLVARPINLGFARESGSWVNDELSTTPRAVLLRTIRGFRIVSDRWDKNHEGSLRMVTTILDSTITKNWTRFENIKLGQDCQLIVRLIERYFVSRMLAESKLTSRKLGRDCSLRMLGGSKRF